MTSPSEDLPATDATAPVTSSSSAPAPPRRRPKRSSTNDPSTPGASGPAGDAGDATALAAAAPTSWQAPPPAPRAPKLKARPVPPPEPVVDPVAVAVVDEGEPTSWHDWGRGRSPSREPVERTGTATRYYRQTVTKVDLWSVTKLALCFYLSAMFVTMVALVALWMIADSAGIVTSVEKFFGDLLSAKDFHFLSAQVLRGAILVALVIVALQVVITVIGASFYNIFAELFGGVEIVVREEEDDYDYGNGDLDS